MPSHQLKPAGHPVNWLFPLIFFVGFSWLIAYENNIDNRRFRQLKKRHPEAAAELDRFSLSHRTSLATVPRNWRDHFYRRSRFVDLMLNGRFQAFTRSDLFFFLSHKKPVRYVEHFSTRQLLQLKPLYRSGHHIAVTLLDRTGRGLKPRKSYVLGEMYGNARSTCRITRDAQTPIDKRAFLYRTPSRTFLAAMYAVEEKTASERINFSLFEIEEGRLLERFRLPLFWQQTVYALNRYRYLKADIDLKTDGAIEVVFQGYGGANVADPPLKQAECRLVIDRGQGRLRHSDDTSRQALNGFLPELAPSFRDAFEFNPKPAAAKALLHRQDPDSRVYTLYRSALETDR